MTVPCEAILVPVRSISSDPMAQTQYLTKNKIKGTLCTGDKYHYPQGTLLTNFKRLPVNTNSLAF